MAWRDKRKPVVISSVHPAAVATITDRCGSVKEKPVIVDRYNQSMGGVDKADCLLFICKEERKVVEEAAILVVGGITGKFIHYI